MKNFVTDDLLIEKLIDIKSIPYEKKFNKIAKIHKYWARKPWYVIKRHIEQNSSISDVVLDPFCGSGVIGLESILCGRRFIGYDLNPIAIFVAYATLNLKFDITRFESETEILIKELKPQMMSLYTLDNPTNSYIKYLVTGPKNKSNYNCVATDYNFQTRLLLDVSDKVLYKHFSIPSHLVYPDKYFPKKFYKDRFSYKGVEKVSDMFSKRNQLALAKLYNYIINSKFRSKKLFILALTNTLLHVSKLKGENIRPLNVNNYWIPDDYIEENVFWRYLDRIKNIKIAKQTIYERLLESGLKEVPEYTLNEKSSLYLDEIIDQSIDYVITDPPYGDAIQYSELSYIWNCWLEKDFNIEDEVIINPVQNKGIIEYHSQLKAFIKSIKRVLKKGSLFTLCFQNKSLAIWHGIIRVVKDLGFELHNIEIYDTFGSPYNKHWARFSPKSDLYVTFRNADKKCKEHKNTLVPEEIINKVIECFTSNNKKEFDLNKGYDLFIAEVIYQIFNDNKVLIPEKFKLKDIVNMFEVKVKNGVICAPNNKGVQMQFPF